MKLQYKKKCYQLHQLAFLYQLGYLPNEVDHINRISDDNRWENLRVCTRTQNSYNSSIRSDNTSGTKGVSFDKVAKKWRVRMYINGVAKQLGSYTDKEEAIRMNKEFRKLHHGDFHMPKVIILDTETSGVSKTDVVIELAFLEANSLQKEKELNFGLGHPFKHVYDTVDACIYHDRYFPPCSINPRAFDVHGIGLSHLTSCPKSSTVSIPDETVYIIGHNISFDKRLLLQSNPTLSLALESAKYICTLALAKAVSKHCNIPFEKHTLDYLAEYYFPEHKDLLVLDSHTAKNDVIKTLLVLLKLVEHLPNLETYGDIFNFQTAMKKVKK